MNATPLVSIIIPCYNHGFCLMETVNSVFAQSYQNIEIIIVNDGSTDELTLQVLREIDHPKIKIIHRENAGPSIARNDALKISSGVYIVPLDADDMIRNDTIAKSVEIVERNKKTAVVYGNNHYFGEEDYIKIQEPFDILKMLVANPLALCTLIRKTALNDAGGFDESISLMGLEDWDLWLSLIEKDWDFKYINEVLFDIRINYNSRTFKVANNNLDGLISYIYKKHSNLLSEYYIYLYHENKNLKNTLDYRIGNLILKPLRKILNRWHNLL